ncbi:MAG: PQQ-dependent sugar dehydrogenase, partial [Actinomycetota bacterium]|nr:PQQ-dependent sugar dehydrogenase [Actinomycetota bacterium]
MPTRLLPAALAAALLAVSAAAPIAAQERPGDNDDPLPRVPPGFAVTTFARVPGTATSVAVWPPAPGAGLKMFVTSSTGTVFLVETVGSGPNALTGTTVTAFSTGFGTLLGVVVAPDGTVYVSDAEATRAGPFGTRTYGRVWRLKDTGGDGVADVKEVVLKDLPNGRHNTNGLAFGPDGLLYVTNGNSTDDGIEGGQPEVVPWSGSVVRVDPAATGLSLA